MIIATANICLAPGVMHLMCIISFFTTTYFFRIILYGCGSVDWVPACEPKGYQFDSQPGPTPGLWARSPVGGVGEVTDGCIARTSTFLSLSFSLPSPLSKN